MLRDLPTYEQVSSLPASHSLIAPPEYVDINGHMNIRHFLAVHDDAAVAYFSELGFSSDYVEQRRRYFFDVEHHLGYHAEVLIGHEIAVHVRLISRSAKIIHYMSFIVNRTNHTLANTLEVTTAHVDLAVRRSTAFDPADTTTLDRRLAADQLVNWSLPVCGTMGAFPRKARHCDDAVTS